MTAVTFSSWLAMGGEERSVVLDGLLERLPEGYVHARDLGHAPCVVPQFIHRATSVLFHLVFGDEVLVGMTEARIQRAVAVRRMTEDGSLPPPEALRAQVQALTPARRVRVPTMLVGELLSGHQLQRLGVRDEVLLPWGLRRAGLGQALQALVRTGWRLPSEVEWEFAVRAAMDSLDDVAPPVTPACRFLTGMGSRFELCRDSWHPDWQGAPSSAQSWGEGHEVVRGASSGLLVPWSALPAWIECVWPSRGSVAQVRAPIGVRPWVRL